MLKQVTKKILYTLDLFAPHFEFYLKAESTRHPTILGGLYTLLIMAVGIFTAIINLNSWYH